ncbi:MAG: hypothetical protein FWE38_04120 [Firmicutes bacterium]|nr:hypothetical protein [Bacillota bacterium]
MEEVTSDLFDIAMRLRDIDDSYRVFYNGRCERFEVHNATRPTVLTMQFVVPYDVLDERTILHARRTRKDNAAEIENEIDLHNRELERSAQNAMDEQLRRLNDMMHYAHRAGHEVTFQKSREWI